MDRDDVLVVAFDKWFLSMLTKNAAIADGGVEWFG